MDKELVLFEQKFNLHEKSEIEKFKYVAYYYAKKNEVVDFVFPTIIQCLIQNGIANPNTSRLKNNIKESRDFIRGSKQNSFILSPKQRALLDQECQCFFNNDDIVISNNEVLDESMFKSSRDYIVTLVKHINACYGYKIFDGCAVLMRRLIEILFIHAYENLNIQNEIKDSIGKSSPEKWCKFTFGSLGY